MTDSDQEEPAEVIAQRALDVILFNASRHQAFAAEASRVALALLAAAVELQSAINGMGRTAGNGERQSWR